MEIKFQYSTVSISSLDDIFLFWASQTVRKIMKEDNASNQQDQNLLNEPA